MVTPVLFVLSGVPEMVPLALLNDSPEEGSRS